MPGKPFPHPVPPPSSAAMQRMHQLRSVDGIKKSAAAAQHAHTFRALVKWLEGEATPLPKPQQHQRPVPPGQSMTVYSSAPEGVLAPGEVIRNRSAPNPLDKWQRAFPKTVGAIRGSPRPTKPASQPASKPPVPANTFGANVRAYEARQQANAEREQQRRRTARQKAISANAAATKATRRGITRMRNLAREAMSEFAVPVNPKPKH